MHAKNPQGTTEHELILLEIINSNIILCSNTFESKKKCAIESNLLLQPFPRQALRCRNLSVPKMGKNQPLLVCGKHKAELEGCGFLCWSAEFYARDTAQVCFSA